MFLKTVASINEGSNMYSGKLIEITQDAACVLREGDAKGFFTSNVETCLIYIIEADVATVCIHDSGQLEIKALAELIRSYGEISLVTIVYGPELNETNKKRLPSVLSSIGYRKSPDVLRSEFHPFSVAYEVGSGVSFFPNTVPDGVIELPDKNVVQTIIELNNNFIPLNSQSLPIDVQFNDGEYCNNSSLIFSLEEMLETYRNQPKYIDINRMFLLKGHQAGLFSLPNDF